MPVCVPNTRYFLVQGERIVHLLLNIRLCALQPGSRLWGVTAIHHSNTRENGRNRVIVRAGVGGRGRVVSQNEEAGLVEMASIDMHGKFLCRLTISPFNLLRVIAEQGVSIGGLNAGRV